MQPTALVYTCLSMPRQTHPTHGQHPTQALQTAHMKADALSPGDMHEHATDEIARAHTLSTHSIHWSNVNNTPQAQLPRAFHRNSVPTPMYKDQTSRHGLQGVYQAGPHHRVCADTARGRHSDRVWPHQHQSPRNLQKHDKQNITNKKKNHDLPRLLHIKECVHSQRPGHAAAKTGSSPRGAIM